jgi:N-acetylmuramoyl-L-alanine amidase
MAKTHILIHHSLTKDSLTVSWGAIRKYHIFTLGYDDIGYTAGTEFARDDYEIFAGRMPFDRQGAHCPQGGMNRKAYSLCFIGNYDIALPPEKMLKKGALFVASICTVAGIPVENVQGHRDYATYKTCPGEKFDLDLFRSMVADNL